MRPLDGYDPRCTCCPLLPNHASAVEVWGADDADRMDFPASVEVWPDRQTGVMTRWLPNGGSDDAVEVEIVDVDADISEVWSAATSA